MESKHWVQSSLYTDCAGVGGESAASPRPCQYRERHSRPKTDMSTSSGGMRQLTNILQVRASHGEGRGCHETNAGSKLA
jgi:hypothetical protein